MLKRLLKQLWVALTGGGSIFIGDVQHDHRPVDIKVNEWGGTNYKYRALSGQYVRTLDVSDPICPKVVWDEITYLSKHCRIPAFRVTLSNGYSIICSPVRTIVVKRNGGYETADLMREDIVGSKVVCATGGVIREGVVDRVENLNMAVDMWDVTLRNHPIFLADDSLFIYDTMAIHTPVSGGAIRDVYKMMPSNNLLAEQSGRLVAEPEHSSIVGLYNLSKTPKGRKRINDILPSHYDINGPLSKADIIALLSKIAKDKGPEAARVINAMRNLGDEYSYESGLTISLSDLKPLKEQRDKIMPDLMREIRALPKDKRNMENLGPIYSKYIDRATRDMDDYYSNSNTELADIYNSMARGSKSQYRDLTFSPIAVSGRDLPAKPIKHSYVEGLSPAEYFIASHGARLGVLGRSQGTAMPGALGKELLATANTLVVNKSKGESMGEIRADIKTWRNSDIVDRYLSRDIEKGNRIIAKKNDLITPRILQKIKGAGINDIWVYSPLQSSSADGGIPAMAYGNNSKGTLPSVGDNIGANSAFALVEPLFTGSMGSFHHGGSLGHKQPAYPRIKQILELTQTLPQKAVLAEASGIVNDIRKDSLGGHAVYIGGAEHYIPPNTKMLVSKGSSVKKGDALSEGPIDPRELASLKDLSSAQNYMVEELMRAVPSSKRKAVETVVEGITRYGQVIDPGDSSYLPGDTDLIATLEKQNKALVNKIKYDYMFKGVNYLPQATQSWLSKMNFRNIKRELTKDISTGAVTDLSSYEPIPAMAFGVDFGKGKKGRY